MLYLGQECVFFVSNGPEMDPRVRHIISCNKIFLRLIQEEQEVSYWQTGKLPRGGGGGGGTLSGQWPKGNISPGCLTKSDTNQA